HGGSDQHLPVLKCHLHLPPSRSLLIRECFPLIVLGVPREIPHEEHPFQLLNQDPTGFARGFNSSLKEIKMGFVGGEVLGMALEDCAASVVDDKPVGFHLKLSSRNESPSPSPSPHRMGRGKF